MYDEPAPRRFPKVPMDRRIAAFAVDFGAVSLVSLLSGSLYIPLFLLLWLGLRVVVVEKNRGQSLGRWAFDIRVVDADRGATPGLMTLGKRELLIGIGGVLVLIGLVNLSPTNGSILVTPIPLLVDCGFAFMDSAYQQAWHDRIARTLVIQTRRGYSLDLKLKSLFAKANRRMK